MSTPNNVRDLMTLAGQEFRNSPDLASFREDLRAQIDQVHRQLCDEFPWPWMNRVIPLVVYPDLTYALASGGITRALLSGNRAFQLPVTALHGKMYPEADRDAWREHQTSLARGGELELEDRADDSTGTVAGTGNWSAAPFTIEGVSPSSGVSPSPASLTFWLDPRADISALPSPEINAIIRFRRRLLPPDVRSIIRVKDEFGRPLRPMMEAEIAMSEADRNRIGTPCWMLEDYGSELRHPPMVWPGLSDGTTDPYPASNPYVWQQETWAVRETLTYSNRPDAGSVKTNTAHRAFATWWWGGRFGPPSKVLEFVSHATDTSYTIGNLNLPPQTTGNHEYGRRIAVWVSEGSTSSLKTSEFGAYYLKGFVSDATASSLLITTSNNTAENRQMRLPRWDEQYFGVQPKYIRIYPRPSEMKRYTLEYRKMPRALIEDTDKPDIDGRYDVLAWLAAAALIGQRGGDNTRALMQAQSELRKLMATAGFNDRYRVRFGQIAGQEHGRPWSYFLEADNAASQWVP